VNPVFLPDVGIVVFLEGAPWERPYRVFLIIPEEVSIDELRAVGPAKALHIRVVGLDGNMVLQACSRLGALVNTVVYHGLPALAPPVDLPRTDSKEVALNPGG